MQKNKVSQVGLQLKLIKLDLQRISMKLEDTNRSIKEILIQDEIQFRAQDLKELVEYNRFLLQKHKEKIEEKLEAEAAIKEILHEENQEEMEIMESEKRMEYFIQTVENTLQFNPDHPYYQDSSFIRDLIKEALKQEDYESCANYKKCLDEASLATI